MAGPNRLSTARKLGAPDADRRSITLRSATSSPNGSTNWYCTKPWRPYTRFHDPTKSSGWKNPGIDRICPTRRAGALRYHISLNAFTERWLISPGDGITGGTDRRWAAAYANGSTASFGGNWSTVAWSPRVSTPRPR